MWQSDDKGILNKIRSVASYMIYWTSLKGDMKRAILVEWKRMSLTLQAPMKRRSMLPILTVDLASAPSLIYRNAVQSILDVGKHRWENTALELQNPLQGKRTLETNKGKNYALIYVSLHQFFLQLKDDGSPFTHG